MTKCQVCFRHCDLKEGQTGFCGARIGVGDKVVASNYGRITSLALDPIEKKPLRRFFPGTHILSVGSYGCNLRCPFCQNSEISWGQEALRFSDTAETITPETLVRIAEKYRSEGNIGIAFTYNEPLIGYEFVRDTAKLAHDRGLKNVMVTNGTAELSVLEEIGPYIDAMNIDLKGFTEHYYNEVLGGSFEMVKRFIAEAVKICHVELTTLVVPDWNDTEEEMRAIASWISGLCNADGEIVGTEIPLHVSRFFPRFHMTDRDATPVKNVYALAEIAREKLKYVYTGNC
ncbi:MAG: AmmeMemoRadiSam system radical SAM enzyme [Clostridiales bacterium]|nr:AmmeMemoRadiSam system radical SAM enzyme [Clostridiales bacterium]MBR6254868.1 AmmeMemoRadiSam system radical SAM enzyme [Clostridiales bacterium]